MSIDACTPEWIDQNIDTNITRHYLFIRFVLGEPHRDAVQMAVLRGRDDQLTLSQMQYIALHWQDDAA